VFWNAVRKATSILSLYENSQVFLVFLWPLLSLKSIHFEFSLGYSMRNWPVWMAPTFPSTNHCLFHSRCVTSYTYCSLEGGVFSALWCFYSPQSHPNRGQPLYCRQIQHSHLGRRHLNVPWLSCPWLQDGMGPCEDLSHSLGHRYGPRMLCLSLKDEALGWWASFPMAPVSKPSLHMKQRTLRVNYLSEPTCL
jgi:hypothetical protein